MLDTSVEIISNKIMTDSFSFLVISARFFGAMSIFPVLAATFFSKIVKVLLAIAFALALARALTRIRTFGRTLTRALVLVVR